MPAPKYHYIAGKVFMEVRPVKKLLHSTMIYDVVMSGRKFAVNMETGELTIIKVSVGIK
jgi:hypothetical protein